MDFPQRSPLWVVAIGNAIFAGKVTAVKELLASNTHAKSFINEIVDVTSTPFQRAMVWNHFRHESGAFFGILLHLRVRLFCLARPIEQRDVDVVRRIDVRWYRPAVDAFSALLPGFENKPFEYHNVAFAKFLKKRSVSGWFSRFYLVRLFLALRPGL
jgi:hypothetical protein